MAIPTFVSVLVGCLLFVGASAQSGDNITTECKYTDCSGNAEACRRTEGVEYCDCPTSRAGYLCDMSTEPCDKNSCQNNGTCYTEQLTNGTYCVCPPGYSGSRCEMEDASKKCGVMMDETDKLLLPTCSLKTTLTYLSQCINERLPYYEPMGDVDQTATQCVGKVVQTKHCFYRTIQQCSLNSCPSIYQYGGVELYERIATEFYNPLSNFSQQLFMILCSEPDMNGTYSYPTEKYNIGAPVCGSDLIDNLLTILIDFGNNYPRDPTLLCPSLIDLRTKIYNEVDSSCNWTNVGAALSLADPPGLPGYVTQVFETAQEFFQEWVVPGCEECTATCLNGGTCYVVGGVSRCTCEGDFHGDSCEFHSGQCAYTSCENGGSCFRENGVEYCLCPDSSISGLFCDLISGSCDGVECQNGGSCYNASGFITCVCQPGYSGSWCEREDESKQCPNETADDIIFLPTCTLKTTLGQLSECINYFLPFMEPTAGNPYHMCNSKITQVKHCMYRTIAGCSGTACESAYEYGGLDLYLSISQQLYNPESNFSMALFNEFCVFPENVPANYTPMYNIGEPVCRSNLIDRLLTILTEYYRILPPTEDLETFCPTTEKLKYALYNESKASCNFSNIKNALPVLSDPNSRPAYWQKVLEMAQEYFLEWTLPVCRVQTNPCEGYCMNDGFCTINFGAPFCSCPQYWGGARCEYFDPTNVCPVPGEGDAALLPLCTLRQTLNGTLHCFADLAMLAGGRSDFYSCSNQVAKSFTCFAHLVGNCSRSTCPSIWFIEGTSEAAQEIFATLLSPEVIGGVAQYVCNPPPQGGYTQFLLPLVANVTIPFCQRSFLTDAVGVLSYLENELMGMTDMSQLCRVAQEARRRIGGLLDQCDFSQLHNYVDQDLAAWLQRVIASGRAIIDDFTLPYCENDTVHSPCPTVGSTSSQCQLADAWMCHYFQYRMSASEWAIQLVDWMEGCSNFRQQNWDDWASYMGFKRGDMGYTYMGDGHGTGGFGRMFLANAPCPTFTAAECMGRRFTTAGGCTICYNAGAARSARDLRDLYALEFTNYQVTMKIYSALLKSCSRSSMSCGGEATSTVPPMPTFSSSGFSSVTFVPPTGPSFTSPWGSGSGAPPSSSHGYN